jgi:hypothetical protein
MYTISNLTGNIYLNGVLIPLDDSTQEFQTYLATKDEVGVEYVEYVESVESELNDIKINYLTLRITNAFTLLRQRALASSIDHYFPQPRP